MWKTLYQSVQGTSHVRSGQPCQDSCAVKLVPLERETVLVLACSDGAGSAAWSQIGSQKACATIADLLGGELRMEGRLQRVTCERAQGWLREVHRALADEADSREIGLRDLACTLLFAVIGQAGAGFGQVGDGAIVVWQNARYQTIFWPQSGEYINTTNFITNPRYQSFLEFAWCDGAVDELALLTDGLQMVALDFRQRQPHGPFFTPMFDALRKHPEPAQLAEAMRSFLDSPGLAERTDDDKTLVLATRVSP